MSHSTTLAELRAMSTDDLRAYCAWNDPNGSFDETDDGDPITRDDLLAIVAEWDDEQRCGACKQHIGLGNAAWDSHARQCQPTVRTCPQCQHAIHSGQCSHPRGCWCDTFTNV